MQSRLPRAYLIELVGTFGLVYFSMAAAILNFLALPVADPSQVGSTSLTMNQPGLLGNAVAQGLIVGVLLSLTLPISGGYLNPAITLMLWVFNRMESKKAAWLIGAQVLGGVLAAVLLCYTFDRQFLETVGFPLTGAGLNPARWLGPVLAKTIVFGSGTGPFSEALIYIGGPILGALLGGLFTFTFYWPARNEATPEFEPAPLAKAKK
ncbi:MAG: aquaporin [Planctomycetes bacterium]|nr:aquaporin [Planctomycetota bacterium]